MLCLFRLYVLCNVDIELDKARYVLRRDLFLTHVLAELNFYKDNNWSAELWRGWFTTVLEFKWQAYSAVFGELTGIFQKLRWGYLYKQELYI